ncbi:MAG TPA: hypothetical protein VEU08_18000, partial [Vicinamibacterales bacterium]|nr:hypothetical protein [Vicinamibacterales bacterium]
NIPSSKFSVFAMDEFFQPNTNVATNPLDFYHVIGGVAYRVSPRWRFAVSTQHVIYKQDQFTYPAASLALFSPTLAAANPGGIANAVPAGINAKFLSFEFTF